MKTSFILAIFALILCSTLAANTNYVKLSANNIKKSQLIQDLRQLGAEYTLEKGIFQQKPVLPNGDWEITKTESAYKKIENGITYYKFTVQLYCYTDPYLIRAKYTVAFKNSNGNTVVSSHSYSLIENPNEDGAVDAPTFIDNRDLKTDKEFRKLLDEGIEYTVKDAIKKGLIKKSTYNFVRVFSIHDTGYSFPYGYTFLIQLVSKKGYNYRAQITVWFQYDIEENAGVKPNPEYTIYPNV